MPNEDNIPLTDGSRTGSLGHLRHSVIELQLHDTKSDRANNAMHRRSGLDGSRTNLRRPDDDVDTVIVAGRSLHTLARINTVSLLLHTTVCTINS